jgi:hypothetical protein
MCNAISTAHPKRVVPAAAEILSFWHSTGIFMSQVLPWVPGMGSHTHTCAYVHAHTWTHVMHSKVPRFSHSDNRMCSKSYDYIKNTYIQNIPHTALKCYKYSLYTADNLIMSHFLTL